MLLKITNGTDDHEGTQKTTASKKMIINKILQLSLNLKILASTKDFSTNLEVKNSKNENKFPPIQ